MFTADSVIFLLLFCCISDQSVTVIRFHWMVKMCLV